MANQMEQQSGNAIEVKNLRFSYANKYGKPILAIDDVTFSLPHGARCLLVGPNGSGKSTILSLFAGKHLHEGTVEVLGKSAFYSTLGLSGTSYLGGSWSRTVGYVGHDINYEADIQVKDMSRHLQDAHPERRDELMRILDIDPEWRMIQRSAGQIRRIQMFIGLLRPYRLLLIDEMTVDIDLLGRAEFLKYLERDAAKRNATIVYATHIFDGMDDWPTHMLMLEQGKLVRCSSMEVVKKDPKFVSLYKFVFDFLVGARDRFRQGQIAEKKDQAASNQQENAATTKEEYPNANPKGAIPSRMMAYVNS